MTDERPLPAWLPTAGVAIALVGLVALSFAERWAGLTESPFPVGVDGYFYPVQLRSLLETGALHYPASPLAFWLMAPLAAATDPITGAKLGAALFGALIALPAYGVGARLGRTRGAGLVAAALATTSAGSAFLSIEFVKNGLGLTMLVTAVWLLLRALEAPTALRIAAALAAGVLALLAHKMAVVLVIAIAVPAVLAEAAGRGVLRGRRLLYVLAMIAAVTGLLLVLGSVFPQRLPSPTDAGLVRELWSTEPRWGAPALVTPRATLTFGYEALIGGALGVLGALVLSRTGRGWIDAAMKRLPPSIITPAPPHATLAPSAPGASSTTAAAPTAPPPAMLQSSAPGASGTTAAAWMIVVLALVIALPWLAVENSQGLGFRLRLAAFVPMALAGALVAGRLLARVHHRDLVLAVIACLLVLRTPGSRTEGRIVAHPAMVAALHALEGEVPAGDTLIIPERHIVFMVAWYTRARVSLRPEQVPAERRWRVMPLAWIGLGSPLDQALLAARTHATLRPPLGLHPRHPNGIVLVAEPTWQWVLAQLPPEVRARWAAWRTI